MAKLSRHLSYSFWGVLDTVCYPILYFALTPSLIRYMGPVAFGFWLLLNTLITVLQLFNFNFGITAMRPIAQARAAGNSAHVAAVINSLLRTTFVQFLLICVLGVLLFAFIRNTQWSREALLQPYGPWCFFLAAALAGLKYFEQLFQNTLKAYDRFRAASVLNMVSRSGALILSVIVAAIWPNIIFWVLLGNIGWTLLSIGLQLFATERMLPFYKPGIPSNRNLQRNLLQYSMWPWLQSIFVVLTFQADRFWVTGYAGLREVSHYALVATMFNHIHMIFSAMVAWAFPLIVGKYTRQEGHESQYRFINSLLVLFATAALCIFYLISPWLLPAWVGQETYLGLKPYVQSFTAFELAFVHSIMPLMLLNGTGRERVATFSVLICCGLCFSLMMAGLWFYHSPVALVQGMTIGAVLGIPVFLSRIEAEPNGWSLLWELLPSVAIICWVFDFNVIVSAISIPVAIWAFWRFYFVHLKNAEAWSRLRRS